GAAACRATAAKGEAEADGNAAQMNISSPGSGWAPSTAPGPSCSRRTLGGKERGRAMRVEKRSKALLWATSVGAHTSSRTRDASPSPERTKSKRSSAAGAAEV